MVFSVLPLLGGTRDEYVMKLKGIALRLYGDDNTRTGKPSFLSFSLPTYLVFFAWSLSMSVGSPRKMSFHRKDDV